MTLGDWHRTLEPKIMVVSTACFHLTTVRHMWSERKLHEASMSASWVHLKWRFSGFLVSCYDTSVILPWYFTWDYVSFQKEVKYPWIIWLIDITGEIALCKYNCISEIITLRDKPLPLKLTERFLQWIFTTYALI